MGRPSEALHSYELARRIQEQLVRDDPANTRYLELLSWTLSNLGVIHLDLDHPTDAIRFHRRAMAIQESVVNNNPGKARYRSDLGWCWRYLGLALAASGELNEALRLLELATELHDELVRAERGDVEFRWRLARCLDDVGRIRFQSNRPAEASEALQRAAELHETLTQDNPIVYSIDLIRNRLYLASQRTLSGRLQEAKACIQRVEDLLMRSSLVRASDLRFDLACGYSLWSVAGQEGAIAADEREARAQRAIAALGRAVVAGYCHLEQIRLDPILDPLRPHRDFQKLMAELDFPADAFAP
jgi:tetratricopeptide (TPR) repeat protein